MDHVAAVHGPGWRCSRTTIFHGLLTHDDGGIARHLGTRRDVAQDECSWSNERSCPDCYALQDGRVVPNPHVVLYAHRTRLDARTPRAIPDGRERDRVSKPRCRCKWMKVRIGDRYPACDHHTRTDLYALRANKRSVCDVTVIADLDDAILISRERRTPDRCATPDTQASILLRIEVFEAERRINSASFARDDVTSPVCRSLR